jgi:protein involved in polysaccharide export with SLBB domain
MKRAIVIILGSLMSGVAATENVTPPPDCEHSEQISVSVSVSGVVKKPGKYTLRASDTPYDAIDAAGGAAPWGRIWKLTLIRSRKERGTKTFVIMWPRSESKYPIPQLCDGDEVRAIEEVY